MLTPLRAAELAESDRLRELLGIPKTEEEGDYCRRSRDAWYKAPKRINPLLIGSDGQYYKVGKQNND